MVVHSQTISCLWVCERKLLTHPNPTIRWHMCVPLSRIVLKRLPLSSTRGAHVPAKNSRCKRRITSIDFFFERTWYAWIPPLLTRLHAVFNALHSVTCKPATICLGSGGLVYRDSRRRPLKFDRLLTIDMLIAVWPPANSSKDDSRR